MRATAAPTARDPDATTPKLIAAAIPSTIVVMVEVEVALMVTPPVPVDVMTAPDAYARTALRIVLSATAPAPAMLPPAATNEAAAARAAAIVKARIVVVSCAVTTTVDPRTVAPWM